MEDGQKYLLGFVVMILAVGFGIALRITYTCNPRKPMSFNRGMNGY